MRTFYFPPICELGAFFPGVWRIMTSRARVSAQERQIEREREWSSTVRAGNAASENKLTCAHPPLSGRLGDQEATWPILSGSRRVHSRKPIEAQYRVSPLSL